MSESLGFSWGVSIPCPRQIWISSEDVSRTEELHGGKEGCIYKGMYGESAVTLKEFNDRVLGFEEQWEILRSLRCKYILKFIGATKPQEPLEFPYVLYFLFLSLTQSQPTIVMEYCRGPLFNVLKDKTIDFTGAMFFKMSKQLCKAIQYLHSCTPQILHKNIHSLSLYVRDNFDLAVGDFGFTVEEVPTTKMSDMYAQEALSIAPEVFSGRQYSTASDVYAISMVLFELAKRVIIGEYRSPLEDAPRIRYNFLITAYATRNWRPKFPEGTPTCIATLISAAWTTKSEDRITLPSLIALLNKAKEEDPFKQ